MDKYKRTYEEKMRHIRFSSFVQIIFALAVVIIAATNTWSNLYRDAHNTASTVETRTNDIMDGYKSAFKSMLVPIEEKIEEDVSFEEMETWLRSKEEEFKQAIGEETYDGIAFTYKGGYVRSWDYGDYSSYVPESRPWYQEAEKANGEITIIAPYVTYLSDQGVEDDVLMTIAQKYNDEIYFDLDLKLPAIKRILDSIHTLYPSERMFIFNNDGQIISTTNELAFSHNVLVADDVIPQSIVDLVKTKGRETGKLEIVFQDQQFQFVYFEEMEGSTICILVPALEVFWEKYTMIAILSLMIVGYVLYLYSQNKKTTIEFVQKDRRLDVIEDAEQKERLYVDIDKMVFFGNKQANDNTENTSYDALYDLLYSRIVDKKDYPRLEAFFSRRALKNCITHMYQIEKQRFVMKMTDANGELSNKTIEMRRLAYMENGTHMVEIAMIDAAESVDLLKSALAETERIKKEKEEEYDRFMSYICSAEDGVEELCIKDHTITRYFVKEGKLQRHTISYPGMPFELFHEEDRQLAHDLYDEDKLAILCEKQEASYAELRMKWNDSTEYHWCNLIVLGLPISKYTPFNVLVLIKDTNEIKTKEMEQKTALEDAFKLAEQGSKAKGFFLSNMSHEIRTPLNAIIGYLTIASDKDCTDEKKNYCIENCQTASKHLLQIINDVLDMSSIENGKLKIANEEFDLKKEIADITTIFYQNAKIKHVQFETHVENLTEEWVVGDQLRVNQILMNLLSNAVKFTPENGLVTLKVEQLRKDHKQVYLKFTVKDTGIGMSKEYMARIFSPFEQENAGTAKKFGGSGLGLSITNNLVHMMGGKIDVESTQNVGTKFEVTLFFDLAKETHASHVHADYSHVRVLVVDDKEDECSYVKMMLKRCGAKADTVTTGEAALKRIMSRHGSDYEYDLCIIDWNMPNMDGCEVTRKIRQELGEKMPIIIATAYDITSFEDEARNAGATKIIAKPLFQSTLFDVLVSSFGQYDPSADVKKEEKVNLSGVKVLLAEDNPMNMDIAVTILEKAGVQVDQAKDGKEAVDKFLAAKEGTYNLILMDVQMPVMDGYAATAKIRESNHPEAKSIPIVAMTANAFAEDVAEALSKGMNAHIAKPIRYEKLFEILKKFS